MDNLLLLTITSILLYVVGIIINDYRDLELDRKERPDRPLPSGKITRRSALAFAFIATILAIILATFVSISSVLLALILLITIVAYDCWLKNNIRGYFTIALARVFNVVLGCSPGIIIVISNQNDLEKISVILVSTFLYVTAISYMSRIEVGPSPKKLKVSTVTTTKRPGIKSQGCEITLCKLCASFNKVPQLTAGGCIPKPKKLKAVSPNIIPGTDKVKLTIR